MTWSFGAWKLALGMDESRPQEEMRRTPDEPVSVGHLYSLGLRYYHFDPATYTTDPAFNEMRKERGYVASDEVCISREKLPDYDNKLKVFFTEHLHEDEEVRYVLDGSGYFDVRDENNDWIRVRVVKGDLVVVPEGIFHRFTLDTRNFMHALRLFQKETKWAAIFRTPAADVVPSRTKYTRYLNHTVFGVDVNNTNVFMVRDVGRFDGVISGILKRAPNAVIAVVFFATKDALFGKPYCSDCEEIESLLPLGYQAASSALRDRLYAVQCVVEKLEYKGVPSYYYRTHPIVCLTGIPTLLMLHAPEGGAKVTVLRRCMSPAEISSPWYSAGSA